MTAKALKDSGAYQEYCGASGCVSRIINMDNWTFPNFVSHMCAWMLAFNVLPWIVESSRWKESGGVRWPRLLFLAILFPAVICLAIYGAEWLLKYCGVVPIVRNVIVGVTTAAILGWRQVREIMAAPSRHNSPGKYGP